ncbi:HTH-type transcriptional regulator LrpA [uncultured archaeon]|nr:HTH-type transcriptional regulator LrpA [uncultured archaeon]
MVENLDLKDKKILYELDINARQSYGSIAKKVGLSKNAVIYRTEQLTKSQVIKSSRAIIDFGKLGLIQFRIYLDLKNASPKKEEEIINFLCAKRIVTHVASVDGAYNLSATLITKNIAEMHELWDELFEKYVNYIEKRLLTILTRNYYYYRPYLKEAKENNFERQITTPIKPVEISSTDLEILKLLAKNARTPIVDISEKLKITPKTVIAHIKTLEKKKIIIGYGVNIDLSKLGYEMFRVSFILYRLTKEKLEEFQRYMMSHPNIIYDEEVVGGDDYEIEAHVKNISELRKIIEDLKSKFVDIIQDYKILHVYKEHKDLTLPEKI